MSGGDRLGPAAPAGAPAERDRSQRLSHFVPRPKGRRAGGRGYSRLVAVSKVVLPVVALVGLGATVWWQEVRELATDDTAGPADLLAAIGPGTGEAPGAGGEVMNPRFESLDENDNPYELRATQALRVAVEEDVMAMSAPQADFVTADGTNVTLVAETGRFDGEADRVMLEGRVELEGDDGTRFETEAATVDVDAGHAWGDRPVSGQGPFGVVEADGFRIFDRGQTVVFVGRSRLVLPGGEAGP